MRSYGQGHLVVTQKVAGSSPAAPGILGEKMGSLGRKISRKKALKEQKRAKKNLKRALNATMGMPTKCSSCSANFDPEIHSDTWMVFVESEKEVVLNYPKCYKEN